MIILSEISAPNFQFLVNNRQFDKRTYSAGRASLTGSPKVVISLNNNLAFLQNSSDSVDHCVTQLILHQSTMKQPKNVQCLWYYISLFVFTIM